MFHINNNVPTIMGILNGTPDSFYSASRISQSFIQKSKYKNADILDIGFESSRPGAYPVDEVAEINRINDFLDKYPNLHPNMSIDTYKPKVAEIALSNGFKIINDIYGGGKKGEMIEVACAFNVPLVIMHMQGNPQTMQDRPLYDNIIDELLYYFENRIKLCNDIGLNNDQIIIDPGIGFGKSIEDNDRILVNLNKFKIFNVPILIGLSRKSFLKLDNDIAEDRLSRSLGASILAVNNGADIIRTHDIDDTYSMFNILARINKIDIENMERV